MAREVKQRAYSHRMRFGVWLVALFTIGVGVLGVVSPDTGTAIRRQYFAAPGGIYAAGAVRLAMGLVVILGASRSRAPKTLRVLGTLMCLQGLNAIVLGPDRARAVLEWEAVHTVLLRLGAAVALVVGGFMAFAATPKAPVHR